MKYTYNRWNVDVRGLWSVLMSAVLLGGASAWAGAIPVGNASFESPNPPAGYPVSTQIEVWQKTEQPVWFDPTTTGGITWDQLSGVFPNVPAPDSRHIDNVDGLQAAYLFALPQVGLKQDSLGANFEVGQAYTLTVGVLGGGAITEGSALLVGLYYVGADGAQVPLGATYATYSAAAFPSATHLVDITYGLPTVQATDPWAGHAIGVQLVSTAGNGAGYWDIDKVRLAAVPEPTLALPGLAAIGALWLARRRTPGRA